MVVICSKSDPRTLVAVNAELGADSADSFA